MNGLRLPLGPLDTPIVWGHPWHGLCQGGVLTLPNATTMPYPQPNHDDDNPWRGGNTNLYRKPGHVAPARTPEQQAADAAAGRQWLDHVILAGAGAQFYGKRVGGWLWTDPAGVVWQYRLVSNRQAGTQQIVKISRCRFGRIGQPDVAVASEVNGLDLQMSGAPAPWRTPPGGSAYQLGDDDYTSFQIVSVRHDGARCVLMWHADHVADDGTPSQLKNRPVAVSELQIASDGTCTHVLLRGRAACLGTLTLSTSPDKLVPTGSVSGTTATYGAYATAQFINDTYSQVIHGRIVSDRVDQYDQSWAETPEVQIAAAKDTTWRTATSNSDTPLIFAPCSGVWSLTVSEQVLTMWYDAAGGLHEITLTSEVALTQTVSPSASCYGELLYDYGPGGLARTGSGITFNLGYAASAETLCRLTLKDNGATVATEAERLLLSESASMSVYTPAVGLRDVSRSYSQMTTKLREVQGQPDVEVGSFSESSATMSDVSDRPRPAGIAVALFSWGLALDGRATHMLSSPVKIPHRSGGTPLSGVGASSLGVVRWSNHAIGLARMTSPNGPTVTQFDTFSPGAVVTPSGVVPSPPQYSTPTVSLTPVCCGTWHPVSGAFASTTVGAGDPTPAMCWV